jgi:hypothetical protein
MALLPLRGHSVSGMYVCVLIAFCLLTVCIDGYGQYNRRASRIKSSSGRVSPVDKQPTGLTGESRHRLKRDITKTL